MRDDIVCEKADDDDMPKRVKTGWVIKETIGIGVANSYFFYPWWKKIITLTFYKLLWFRQGGKIRRLFRKKKRGSK